MHSEVGSYHICSLLIIIECIDVGSMVYKIFNNLNMVIIYSNMKSSPHIKKLVILLSDEFTSAPFVMRNSTMGRKPFLAAQ